MRLISTIVLSCLLATHALAADVWEGWEGLRWGAGKKQVMEAYPTAVDGGWNADMKRHILKLKNHRMGGYEFEVTIIMDKDQRLEAVSMVQDSEPAKEDQRMVDLKRVLTERYGKPTKEGVGADQRVVWSGENGLIELYRSQTMPVRPTVFILYSAKPKAEKEPADL